MKGLFTGIFLLCFIAGKATNYYVDSTGGNDTNTGTSAAFAWQTLTKVNSATYASGDVIYFKRGNVFPGTITVNRNTVSFGLYGTGAAPVITGFITLTSWSNQGSGIWKCNVSAASTSLNIVTINGVLQRRGRWPNYDAATGGWLSQDTTNQTGPYTPFITDNQLTSITSTNWTGAVLTRRVRHYTTNNYPIISQVGNRINFRYCTGFDGDTLRDFGSDGYGYFIQDDLRTLDTLGEWFLNKSTKDLYMYFGAAAPSSFLIKASVQDIGLNCGDNGFGAGGTARTNVTADGLAFEGYNKAAVWAFNGASITVTNCTANNCYQGVFAWNVQNTTVTDGDYNNCLNNGIAVLARTIGGTSGVTISRNKVHKIALLEGMAGNGSNASTGILQSGNATIIDNNSIDSVGYNGIDFRGSNVLIKKNWVNYVCMNKDDGGNIYTWGDTAEVSRVVDSNFVFNAIGDIRGRNDAPFATYLLYADGRSRNVNYKHNIGGYGGTGFLANDPKNIKLDSNVFYKTNFGFSIARFPETITNTRLTGDTITNNLFWGLQNNIGWVESKLQVPDNSLSFAQSIINFGPINNNTYVQTTTDLQANIYYSNTIGGTTYNYQNTTSPGNLSYANWRAFSHKDSTSKEFNGTGNTHFYVNPSSTPITIDLGLAQHKNTVDTATKYNNSVIVPAWSYRITTENGLAPVAPVTPVIRNYIIKRRRK
jgi:hypothetical protein